MSDVQTLTTVTVRYFAAARAAAGVESERLDVPAGGTVADVLAAARARHGTELARVLRALFLPARRGGRAGPGDRPARRRHPRRAAPVRRRLR